MDRHAESFRTNLELWNAWTRINAASASYDVASFVDGTRPIRLADYEIAELGDVAEIGRAHV